MPNCVARESRVTREANRRGSQRVLQLDVGLPLERSRADHAPALLLQRQVRVQWEMPNLKDLSLRISIRGDFHCSARVGVLCACCAPRLSDC